MPTCGVLQAMAPIKPKMRTSIAQRASTLVILFSILTLGATAPAAQATEIRGFVTCETWIREKDPNRVTYNKGWLLGFLSGVAVQSDREVFAGTGNESIFVWTDQYCHKNPRANLGDAGTAYIAEQEKKKRF